MERLSSSVEDNLGGGEDLFEGLSVGSENRLCGVSLWLGRSGLSFFAALPELARGRVADPELSGEGELPAGEVGAG